MGALSGTKEKAASGRTLKIGTAATSGMRLGNTNMHAWIQSDKKEPVT